MPHPLAVVHPHTRLPAAVDPPPPPAPGRPLAEAFAPQLARACGRGLPVAASVPAGHELRPVSQLAELEPLRPWAAPAVEEHPLAGQGGDAAPDTSDEGQANSAEEDAVEPSLPSEIPAGPVLLASGSLLLSLADGAGGGAEGAAAESSGPAPGTQLDAVGEEPAGPGRSRGEPTAKPTAEPTGELAAEAGATGADAGSAIPATPALAKAGAAKSLPGCLPQGPLPPPAASGTPGASSTSQMNLAQDMNKNSELAEQILPPATMPTALVVEKAGAPRSASGPAGAAGDSANALVSLVGSATESSAPAEKVLHVVPVDPTAKVVALMASAVVRLRQTGEDSFEVAIQPDPNTEIWLRVSMQGTGTEIQAELRRGDGAAFAARWSELQEQLARQGVKLAALAAGQDRAGGFGQNPGFASPQRQPEPEGPGAPLGGAVRTTTVNTSRAVAAPPGRAGGWETWA